MSAMELLIAPHSIEAEQSLLGGLLLDSRAWDRMSDVVTEADFFRDDHRRIFRHIATLAIAGKEMDIISVSSAIDRSNETEQTGGMAYLAEIANSTPSAANIRRHAEIVKERATLRRLIAIGTDLQDACLKPGKNSPEEIVDTIEKRLAEEMDSSDSEPVDLYSVFQDALSYIDQRSDTSGLDTGIHGFDSLTGGLEPGQLAIVAARPSVGKTAMGCNVADYVAAAGKGVLFFTLEMTKREIGMRIIAARSGVSMHSMRSGTKIESDWASMTRGVTQSSGQRLWIDDKPSITVGYVRSRAKRLKRLYGLDLIVIDYLGLMKGQGENRAQEVGSISRGLKALAKELQTPIIALAQLNRGVESRTDKRPLMSDLRDSGEVEQDADIVAMLHRESLYSDAPEWSGIAELLVRKNRNGPTGDLLLAYHPTQMRFVDHCGTNPRRALAVARAHQKSGTGGFE